MPVGIIVNVSAVVVGSLIGALLGKKIPERVESALTMTIGLVAIAVGVNYIVDAAFMGALALALIFGVVIGELCKLDTGIRRAAGKLSVAVTKNSPANDEAVRLFSIFFVICCFSGLGIYGSLTEGMSGGSEALLIKAILDFATALIFAATAGYVLTFIGIPMLAIYLTLFFTARLILPLMSAGMTADFQACAGAISVAAGFSVLKVKEFRLVNFIPALILVLPISYLWGILV